jgi:hypothetical protein
VSEIIPWHTLSKEELSENTGRKDPEGLAQYLADTAGGYHRVRLVPKRCPTCGKQMISEYLSRRGEELYFYWCRSCWLSSTLKLGYEKDGPDTG